MSSLPFCLDRLTDLYRAMNPHVRPSVTNGDEESGLGVWPPGVAEMRGGKKGDILKLVRQPIKKQ